MNYRIILAILPLLLSGACSSGSSGSPTPATTPSTTTVGSTSTTTSTTTNPTPPIATSPQQAAPRYPVVLIHGVAGPINTPLPNHFVDVPARLQSFGCRVLRPNTPAFHSAHTRALDLKAQIEAAFPDPNEKVNLVAHSMGGLDCRYLITHLNFGSRVASLTTIGTPHQGTPLSDIALGLLPGPVQQVIDFLLNVLGWDWDFVRDTSENYVQNVFNPTTPDDPSVYYQSYGGIADPLGQNGGRLRILFIPTWGIVAARRGDNDGMIPFSSTQWGTFRGRIDAEHGDQIGIFENPNSSNNWDHLQFYEDLARDLAIRGF